MNHYELAYVLDPDLAQEALSATSEGFTSLISENGGTITGTASWGKRRLAFELNKKREGCYFFVQFESDGALLPELNRQLRLSDKVVRHMIVKLDERYLDQAALPTEEAAPASEEVPEKAAASEEGEGEPPDTKAEPEEEEPGETPESQAAEAEGGPVEVDAEPPQASDAQPEGEPRQAGAAGSEETP